jgi:hypothetical protein
MTRIGHPRTSPFPRFSPLGASLRALCFATLTACATAQAPAAQEPAASPARIEPGTSIRAESISVPREGDPAKLATAIVQLTSIVEHDAANHDARLKLAEAHYVMAESIAVLGWKDQGDASAHLVQSANAVAGIEHGAAHYWLGASTYAQAKNEGYAALLNAQAEVQRLMESAAQSAAGTDHGGAHRVLASLASHPADPTLRDLKRAREQVNEALAIDPRSVANLSAFIDDYAVPAQDRAALSEKLQQLDELKSDASQDAVAAARAKQLAASIEDRLE